MRALAAAVVAACSGHAAALPTGAQPVAGKVSIARPDAATLNVTQRSDKAIVDWASFNVGRGEAVNFAQPAATSVILNRVIGGSYSEILGRISANGQVFLVNPLGITLGTGAHVDAAGFVASTLAISDSDFLSGRYVFSNPGNAGAVVNRGVINTTSLAALLGPQVGNEGTISARLGTVGLAAGDRVSLDFRGDGLVKFSVDKAALNASINNQGAVVAEGGNIVMTAQSANALLDTVINMEGVARATALSERNGTIVLDGGSAGVVAVSGTVDASGRGAGQAGGTVKLLGDKVGLFDGARIDASGDRGGGTVLVGGNWQGKGPERNSSATFASAEASIAADAITHGNGGKVVLWSDGVTRAGTTITARGGARGGDGGAVEVSGKRVLEFLAKVDAGAPAGKPGMLLLDPTDLTVSNATDQRVMGTGAVGDPFEPQANPPSSRLDWASILAALATADVFVTTVGSPTEAGHDGTITIAASPAGYNSGNDLTFTADGSININFSILNAGAGGFTFTAAAAGKTVSLASGANLQTDGGAVAITGAAGITLAGNITTGGGNVTLNNAVTLNAANVQITAGTGTVNFVGAVNAAVAGSHGLTVDVTGPGSITFGGAVGDTPLSSLTILGGGATNLSGNVSTTTTQTYAGALNLGAATTVLTGTTGTFNGGIDGNGNNLTLTFSGTAALAGGTLTDVNNLVSNGTGGTSISGDITTLGSQTYSNLVTLAVPSVTLTGTTGAFSGGVAGGGNDLTLRFSAPSTLSGGTFTNINNLTVDGGGTTSLSGTFTTTGTQRYDDAVALGGITTLTAPTIVFNNTVGTAGNNLTLTTDALTVSGADSISGGGALTFQPRAAATAMTINNAVLSGFADGFSSITLGRADGTALTTVNAVALRDPTTIRQQGAGGSIQVAGNITGSGDASVLLNSGAGGTINLDADITGVTQAGFTGAVVLGVGPRLVSAGAGGVAFQALSGAQDLTVTSTGTTTLAAPVTGLTSLTTNGAGGTTAINTTTVTTTGAQTYNAVALGAAGPTTLTSTGGSPIVFSSTVDGARDLIVSTADATTFGGAVGTTPLTSLSISGGTANINGGSVTTTGAQTYAGALNLGAATTVLTGTTGTFNGGIDGNGNNLTLTFSGTAALAGGTLTDVNNLVSNGTGGTSISGDITTLGSQTYSNLVTLAVPSVTLTGTTGAFSGGVAGGGNDLTLRFSAPSTLSGGTFTNINNLTVDGGGTTSLSGTFTTTGTQRYDDAVALGGITTLTAPTIVFNNTVGTAGNNLTLTTDALTVSGADSISGGGALTFQPRAAATAMTINNAVLSGFADGFSSITLGRADGTALTTVNAVALRDPTTIRQQGAGGSIQVAGNITGSGDASVLLNSGAGGTINLDADITGVTQAGFTGAVVLGVGPRLVSAGAGGVAFQALSGAQDLTVTSTGTTTLAAPVTGLTSLTTNGAGGTTAINTTTVTTTGAQTYNAVALGAAGPTTLTSTGGSPIVFSSTVDGARDLIVSTADATTFGGAVGTTPLTSLSISGGTANINGGSVTTTGAQTYAGALNLGAATTVLTGTTGTFNGGIDGNGNNLTLTFSGTAALAGGTLTDVNNLVSNGTGGTSISGDITTLGSQTYSNLVTLAVPSVTLTGTTGAFSGGVAGGGNDLTLRFSAPSTLSGGTFTNINNLTVDGGGTTSLSGTFTTTGTQRYDDAVALGGITTLTAPTIVFNNTVGTAGNNLTLTTDALTVSGADSISGGGALTFQPRAAATAMTINNAVLSGFADGFSSITLGRADGTALTTVNAVALRDPTTIRQQGAGGSIQVAGNITGSGDASVLLNSGAGGTINLDADITGVTQAGFTGAVVLGVGPRLVSAGAGGVAFQALSGAQDLTVTSTGTTTLAAPVTGLTSLTTNGAGGTTAINTTTVTTTGAQTYNAVALGAAGPTTLTSTGGSPIVFSSTVDGARDLIVSTADATTFGGAVGTTPLTSLSISGGTANINGGSVTTTGAQTYAGALNLGAATTVLTGTTGTFNGGIDGNGNNLTLTFSGTAALAGGTLTDVNNLVSNGTGGTSISGDITTLGSQTYSNLVTLAVPSVTLTGTTGAFSGGVAGGGNDLTLRFSAPSTLSGGTFTNINNLTVDGGGTTSLSGTFTTTGTQRYDDAVALGASVTVFSTSGGNITFGSTIDGAQTLEVNTTGTTTFGGAVGTTPLTSLTTDAGGTTLVSGGSINAGTQTYNDALTLGGAITVLTGTTGTFTGAIAGGGFDLTLNFSGATAINGTTFSNVNNLASGGGGTTSLSGTITTTGSQTYDDAVTLSAATALVSTGNQAIALNNTVNGAQTLAINTTGATTFGGAVGAATALTSVETDAGGTTTIAGTGIRTTGTQTYNDAVLVTGAATLASTGGGAIAFNSTLDGPGTLNVNTTGATTFNNAVGVATPLGSLTTDAGGTTSINTTDIRTSGGQTYNDAVALAVGTTLASTGGGNIAFAGTVNGAQTLAVNTSGTTTFGGIVGGGTPLASIATDAGGTTAINTSAMTTTGAQTYGDAVVLAGATTFVTAASPVSLGSTLVAPSTVTVNGASTLDVAQAIGNLTVILATQATASVNATGNLSVQGAANQTIVLGNSSAGGTLNVDAAGSGSITQLDGTQLTSGGNLRLRAPNGEITLADVTSGTRIELNNTGPAAGLAGEGKAILQHVGTELNAPFVRLIGGFNGLGPDNNALGERTAPIRFGTTVQQVDYAAPASSLVFFAGPIELEQANRIFLINPPGGTETFDFNGGSGRVASNVAGEVVGAITSQITDQVDESFRPGRIDQAILFGFQGDLSLAAPPVFGAIRGVLLPPVSLEEAGADERKKR